MGSQAPLYVTTDIHGHRSELHRALGAAGLVDLDGRWVGGRARLWFLGDYVDRGSDGVGVLDDIRRLAAEASTAGGEVGALLGNHEAQLLAAHRFGSAPIPGRPQDGSFRRAWLRYGGVPADMRRLTSEHVAWLSGLPAVGLVDGYLLLHADSGRYTEFGSTAAEVNTAVHTVLAGRDHAAWSELCRRLSQRGAFREEQVAQHDDRVAETLRAFGGHTIVHGHSTLRRHFCLRPPESDAAHRYAGGRVIATDGGVFEGGPLLVTRLI